MQLQRGSVVRSISGRDKNTFHTVVELGQDEVFVADGKTRKLAKPKRKNIKHVASTNTVLDLSEITTDKKLRAALWPFNYGSGPQKRGE